VKLIQQEGYPAHAVCRLLGYPRSSYYHYYHYSQSQASKVSTPSPTDEVVREAIQAVASRWSTYGYRRITAQLRRSKAAGGHELVANHKRVRRLMKQMGLQGKVPRRTRRTTNSTHSFPRYPNLVEELKVEQVDQLWVGDITYVRLHSEFVYLAVVMDIFTRSIRGWHLSRWLDANLTETALRRALAGPPTRVPRIHHSDQGVQYAAGGYVQMLVEAGVAISMAEVGAAWQNGYAERLIRTIKEEEVDLSEYINYNDAYQQIGRFLGEVYQHKRIHSSLGYLTPAEFETQWNQSSQDELTTAWSAQPGQIID